MSGSVSLIDGHIDEVRICPICGKEFVPLQPWTQIYCCKECRELANRQKAKGRKRAYRYRYQRPVSEPKPVVQASGKRLDSFSGEELLHYGQLQQERYRDNLRVYIPSNMG
jgi:predicted nucleic acid-binding Zn ribbon protein